MLLTSNPVRRLLGLEPVYGGKRRSSKWPALRKRFLAEFPACAACGRTENVVPHHIAPYHVFPERELDWDNLIALCENKTLSCHLWLGHAGNFHWWNPSVRDDSWWFSAVLDGRQP